MFRVLQIETTTFCNASCWFCPNMDLGEYKHMSMDTIIKLIDETKDFVKIYRPFGLGEPFVDKRMPIICKYIKENTNAVVEINTNAAPLTPHQAKLIAPYVNIIRFSLDGYSPEAVGNTRKINGALAIRNTEHFIKTYPDIVCEVRMIDIPEYRHEQQHFLDYWNAVRSGCAEITKLYDHPWTAQTESTSDPCVKCQNEAFVYVDGSVHPCPWDFDSREVLGNINNDSLVSIWKSYKYKKLREGLSKGLRSKYTLCSRCSAVFNNKIGQ